MRAEALEVVKRDVGQTLESGPRLVGAAIRCFDSFVLDVRSRELRTDDRSIVLQAQPFEILLVLLGRAGQVVDREELQRRLWPDGTFVDYEHSLNAAIKRLRNALGDDADRPRFIETIPRRGYRFVAPVMDTSIVRPRPLPANPHSIRLAVLPVTPVGAANEFAEGLTEELRAQVGRMSAGAVAVIARSSSMMFEGRPRRASEIGEALRADYLLEGSVRGDGDRVRITVCLVETLGETHVWSESVECRSRGPLSTQVEVATRFAQSLTRKLLNPA
jgi:DNA-binding winged helix-turn-helix (wHTH) protein